jgi:DNA-directed RNA polymerase subunit M/transcription elongation factor TFIIS
MRFCTVCMNRLEDVTNTTELYYECTKCQKRHEKKPEDTLRFSQDFGKQARNTDTVHSNAAFDNANPKIYKDCPNPKCNKKILTYVIVGESMKYMYMCTCGYSGT